MFSAPAPVPVNTEGVPLRVEGQDLSIVVEIEVLALSLLMAPVL